MSPSKPPKVLKLIVPKHNSDKLSAAAAAAVRECARLEGRRFHGNGPKALVTNAGKAASSENASEWNSLVVHARAERGPQFDVGTQLFHVDQGSDLYFDSTILYTSEELLSHRMSSSSQVSVPPPEASIQLRTPNRAQDPGSHYPFMASQVHQASPHPAQYSLPSIPGLHPHSHLGTPGAPGHGGLPPHFQQQHGHGLPPGYGNSPAFMGGRPGGPPQMNGMMNGIPGHNLSMQIPGMNGHTASPSPARTVFPGGSVRGLPPTMNLFPS